MFYSSLYYYIKLELACVPLGHRAGPLFSGYSHFIILSRALDILSLLKLVGVRIFRFSINSFLLKKSAHLTVMVGIINNVVVAKEPILVALTLRWPISFFICIGRMVLL